MRHCVDRHRRGSRPSARKRILFISVEKHDMTESDVKYVVIPLHHRPDLIKDCCKLLNSEWPRSETARMKSLSVSCDDFPTCLVLINGENKVLGHCKISLVARSKISCFIESVVIDYRCRSKGLGSRLLRGVEEYVAKRGLKNIYLKTDGQEMFYYKNGYKDQIQGAKWRSVRRTIATAASATPDASLSIVKVFRHANAVSKNTHGQEIMILVLY
ncbi:PREDICTED: N-acetyltransferase 6 isoform X2 [Acromyrmex echinatior]|uniref:N-acetyltransferase 6 isoform X2 n=1 Tax=Acromyrmex echinatior TaxID=103372 RepID=UPI000580C6BC|nr:PREDICTED: N-acetyltransferase 6 isoform X2 [Acromyrmex echinatior]